MPATITFKNIHGTLKSAAETNHRSLNDEVIARLEKTLEQPQNRVSEHLAGAQGLRKSISNATVLKIQKINVVKLVRADRDSR